MSLSRPSGPRRRAVAMAEPGFAMASVVIALGVAVLLTLVAYAAAHADQNFTQRNSSDRRADAAAEAGVAWFRQQLSADPEAVVRECSAGVAGTSPKAGPGGPLHWNDFDGAKVAVEILPDESEGYTQCVPGNDSSILDKANMMKIRTTGKVAGATKSMITTFRRRSFIDYLYFTDLETGDPETIDIDYAAKLTVQDASGTQLLSKWAADHCSQYLTRDGGARGDQTFNGSYVDPGTGALTPFPEPVKCSTIVFNESDVIYGPLHSNDDITTCGSATIGTNDGTAVVEFWRKHELAGCNDEPDWLASKPRENAVQLKVPAANTKLLQQTLPAYVFTGNTKITMLRNGYMHVTREDGTASDIPYPPNGLVYVKNADGAVCPATDPHHPYLPAPGCGDAYVYGEYSADITVGSQRDIIITHGYLGSSPPHKYLAGLVANDFVRFAHKLATDDDPTAVCTPATPAVGDLEALGAPAEADIEASMIAVRHVVMLDHPNCGPRLKYLTIWGSVSQRFRGQVGGVVDNVPTGYAKGYYYDAQLRVREPPSFLEPTNAPWRIVMSSETLPTAQGGS